MLPLLAAAHVAGCGLQSKGSGPSTHPRGFLTVCAGENTFSPAPFFCFHCAREIAIPFSQASCGKNRAF